MHFVAAAILALGTWAFSFALTLITTFARIATWNVALSALSVAATGVAITAFITLVQNQIQPVLAQLTGVPIMPYYLPNNITLCLSAYITVKIAGTVFNRAMSFIERREMTFKA